MKKRVLWLLILIFLCGCQNTIEKQEEQNTIELFGVTETPMSEITEFPESFSPTETPAPTNTPTPTITLTPTPTQIPDTTAPVIDGLSDKEIYVGETVSYKKGVSVSDDTDTNVELEIDASAVDLDTAGVYQVVYKATDAAGNVVVETINITVKIMDQKEAEVNKLADELIAELITEDMSKWDTCYKLWNWCRTKIKYAYSAGDRSTIYAGAYEGLHDRSGDCYAYYATFTILLQKCGIETLEVRRVGGESNHWWNLVNLGDGWYHCDSSPRKAGHTYKCFMQTDAQIQEYEDFYKEKPNYYTFDKSLYPERETTIIYNGN
ncbi:MAG: transglutaminase domain-containing protein [Lachnospiraceae bacterium]|nr:transglutaminase domain-containing protein [Lachnospiraceae bacterium]